MFNRANKLTALLVAAGATIGLLQTQAFAAVNRLVSMEGEISDAIIYNGKYLYNGYKGDESSDIYYCNGSIDKIVEDNSDYQIDFQSKYGQKYVVATDNGDDYLLDLSTGKIDDENSIEEKQTNLTTKLKSTLKKTDRYENISNVTLERINNSRFGDVWYKYEAGNYYGLVNESGRYIDLCNLANLYVVNSEGEAVKLEEYEKENKGLTAEVPAMSDFEIIAQDNSNFYAKVVVTVTGDNAPSESVTCLQKISKSQGSQKDEAYLPNQVTSYIISENLFSSSDVRDGAAAFNEAGEFFISGGNLYTIKNTTDTEIKVTKFLLKKEKLNLQDTSVNANKIDIQVLEKDDEETHDITSGSNYSIDTNGNVWGVDKGKVFKISALTSTDVYSCDSSLKNIDVYNDNNLILWGDNETYSVVAGGSQKETTISGSSSSDDDDDNSSSGSSGGSSGGSSNTESNTNTATNGTVNNTNGYVSNTNGVTNNTNGVVNNTNGAVNNTNGVVNNATNGVVNNTTNGAVNNTNGVVNNTNGTVTNTNVSTTVNLATTQTGWFKNADETWSFGENGFKKTGWINDGGNWYYCDLTGNMKTGWIADGENWYYANESGVMQTGWLNLNNTWYYLNESGVMQTGWVSDAGNWYYMNTSGDMATGWLSDNGTWYYLDENGVMLTNVTVNGYKLGANGAWVK